MTQEVQQDSKLGRELDSVYLMKISPSCILSLCKSTYQTGAELVVNVVMPKVVGVAEDVASAPDTTYPKMNVAFILLQARSEAKGSSIEIWADLSDSFQHISGEVLSTYILSKRSDFSCSRKRTSFLYHFSQQWTRSHSIACTDLKLGYTFYQRLKRIMQSLRCAFPTRSFAG